MSLQPADLMARRSLTLLIATGVLLACARPVRSTLEGPMTPRLMAQLWSQPSHARDLFWGVGGRRLAPDPDAQYRVIDIKEGGFSGGLTVKGPAGRTWSAKFPPEAATEVVASRLLWGVGFHQPPIYYVGRWNAEDAPRANPQLPARFREQKPDLSGLDAKGDWSYYHNPFADTTQMHGLLVLQVMLGNSDLKDDQNRIYELDKPLEGADRWYVARDLGQSFGRTGVIDAPRGDIQAFESTRFIVGVEDGFVRFDYRGRHRELISKLTPADVHWICQRLQTLTDKQWSDAFRAGGYAPELADRFIRRFKQKIREGFAIS
jgi:hypothetical protein